jgi:hypothetical protein
MAKIRNIRFSQESEYNGKKIAEMSDQEKEDLIDVMAAKGTLCVIEGYND